MNVAATMMWPTMTYRDAPAAIDFLVRAFGFDVAATFPGETEGTVAHAELLWPLGGGVMLSTHSADSVLAELLPGAGCIYIVTGDPDPLFARAVAAGATVVQPPTDQHYGSRDFTVRDPEGVFWSFGTYTGPEPR